MRAPIILGLVVLAGCSETEAPQEEVKAASLSAGEWETTSEITSFRQTDKAPKPAIKGAVGEKTVSRTCIASGEVSKPPASLFVGTGPKCTSRSNYVRNGRLNVTFTCNRPGLQGDIQYTVEGSFTGTDFNANINTESYLFSDGDVAITSKLTGRRIGECPPAAAG